MLTFRNPEKVAALKEHIKAAGGGGTISAYTYDLSSFAEIHKLAKVIKAEHKSIDVLINNAGIFAKQKSLSKDGVELTWAVNMLAPFLLTSLLLNNIQERIVSVGSMALASSLDFDNLQQVISRSLSHQHMQIKLTQAKSSHHCSAMHAQHMEGSIPYHLSASLAYKAKQCGVQACTPICALHMSALLKACSIQPLTSDWPRFTGIHECGASLGS